jgi:hypothetical protein
MNRQRGSEIIAWTVLGAAGIVLAVTLGWVLDRYLVPTAVSVALATLGATLLLANVVVKDLNDSFTKQIERLDSVDARDRDALATYISARRAEVQIGWVAANIAGAICTGVGGAVSLPSVQMALTADQRGALILVGFGAFGVVLPLLVRIARFMSLRDRFTHQISSMIAQQKNRSETLARLHAGGTPLVGAK